DGELIVPRPLRESRLRRQLELQGAFVVGYSGNLGRAHEYNTILEAARLLSDTAAIVFLFTGGGARFHELRREVEAAGLQNFRFLPYRARAELPDALAASNVHLACLLPGLEGLIVPSKAYGVLAAGRPLISIGALDGELARLVNSHACGSSVACGDGAALAAEILRMSTDPISCERMGSAARAVFEEQYSLDSALIRWQRILRSVHGSFGRTSQLSGKA